MIFRTPVNDMFGNYYTSDPYRPVNRHNQRCSGAFADGHAAAERVSTYGFQYWKYGDGATWVPPCNGTIDPRCKWDMD